MLVHTDQQSERNIFIGALFCNAARWPAAAQSGPAVTMSGGAPVSSFPLCPPRPTPRTRPAVGFGLYASLSIAQYFTEYAKQHSGGPLYTGNDVANNVLK